MDPWLILGIVSLTLLVVVIGIFANMPGKDREELNGLTVAYVVHPEPHAPNVPDESSGKHATQPTPTADAGD